ncbi:signal peptidase II [Fibrella aestuarina BUZ 2]|uniref:Lipoprotein signal peptidase n=1 Tax=Fibrella aestuarina BUZ 2 TaxID=1166018 RepID=I0K8U1_9BACT|nr:lipoprotein signal peptidase [Fibrella aestuarina]CCH00544.1 signal peptidase II [Fibrella aestuarina BUZ 2]
MIQKNPIRFFLLALLLIGIDQASKLWILHYMQEHLYMPIHVIGDWLKFQYVLNPGMAFGMELNHQYGKLFLSVFRLFAMAGIGWYLVYLAKRGAPNGLLYAMALILAGAIGNVIDSTFYGVYLNNAPYGAPTPWFHGQVIDFIFVDAWEGILPRWIPIWGGQYFSMPIFNFADSCIFVGVCLILFFQRRFYQEQAQHDNLLPDAPDATNAAVLPTAEVFDETERTERNQPDEVTNATDQQDLEQADADETSVPAAETLPDNVPDSAPSRFEPAPVHTEEPVTTPVLNESDEQKK